MTTKKIEKIKNNFGISLIDKEYKMFYPEKFNQFILLLNELTEESATLFMNKFESSGFMLWLKSLGKEELINFLMDASNNNVLILMEIIIKMI